LTLPKYYDPLVTALETLEPNKLTLEFVKGKLLDQEVKRMNQNDSYVKTNSSSAFTTRGKGSRKPHGNYMKRAHIWTEGNGHNMGQRQNLKFNCYNCGKAGRKRSNCWKNNNGGSRQGHNADRADQDQEEEDGFALLTSACMVTSGEAVLGNVK